MPEKQTAEVLLARMRRNWPEAVTPTSEAMIRVYRLGDLVQDNACRALERQSLTFSEFEVLAALRSADPPHELAPTALYGAILVSSGGLTKILRGLEDRGLVARTLHAADRRSRLVRLTEPGRTMAERAMADVLASDTAVLSQGCSADEMKALAALLRRVLAAVEA